MKKIFYHILEKIYNLINIKKVILIKLFTNKKKLFEACIRALNRNKYLVCVSGLYFIIYKNINKKEYYICKTDNELINYTNKKIRVIKKDIYK